MHAPLIFAFFAVAASSPSVSVSSSVPAGPSPAAIEATQEGHRLYFQGQPQKALAAYQRALALDASALEARLSGAVLLEEMGQLKDAALWLRKAGALSKDPKIGAALGWALMRLQKPAEAQDAFRQALSENPGELFALLGLARVLARSGHDEEALGLFERASAAEAAPNVLHFWRAQAHESRSDPSGAIESYKKAIINDSYFVEARYALGRAFMRANRFDEALTQFMKMVDVDPDSSLFRSLRQRILRRATRPMQEYAARKASSAQLPPMPPTPGRVPTLRVGIGTNAMGKPLPRKVLAFRCDTPFELLDSKSGQRLASGEAGESWVARAGHGKKPLLEISRSGSKAPPLRVRGARIRPEIAKGGMTRLGDIPYGQGYNWGGVGEKSLRGEVELSLYGPRRILRIVNTVDLESYTHGLLSAEMPIGSPLEALKAQSVVARSEALYMKQTGYRHRKEGYDLCDEQHCQVYSGVGAESERSRSVVNATSARVLAFRGRIAHGIYSSNCGGHTQAGADIHGWGHVEYWLGVRDAPAGAPEYPRSPWALRWWLRQRPAAFCMPTRSGYVHGAHYRWSRVVPASELQEKMNRQLKIGKLLRIQPLRRARSGHVNSVLVVGSKRKVTVQHETKIRHLLGLGSQRSTLFTLETEPGAEGRPESFVFYGAGWGHGVGMCQSGAMGRAEQGQSYVDILRAYYPSTELGNLNY